MIFGSQQNCYLLSVTALRKLCSVLCDAHLKTVICHLSRQPASQGLPARFPTTGNPKELNCQSKGTKPPAHSINVHSYNSLIGKKYSIMR